LYIIYLYAKHGMWASYQSAYGEGWVM